MLIIRFMSTILGPYFKYRTFDDSYKCGYSSHADCFSAVFKRMRPVPVYVGFFLLSDYLWPLKVWTSNDLNLIEFI